MFKGCMFDLDGTLLNTIHTISHYGNQALRRFGLPEIETETYKRLVGEGAGVLVQRMLKENGVRDDALFSRVYEYYVSTYDADPYVLTEIYPGIPELLGALRARGMALSVLSNKPHAATVKVIQQFFPAGTFQYVYGAREGVPKKPDPAMANYLLKEMGLSPSDCLYVGDTSTDMQTGKAAGIFTIGVLWGFRGREELEHNGAGFIAQSPSDILSCL
ncbi:MAG TPA: HAD family hydrolase [Candidatus Aphodoplasma excrementigallinarum]|uniref:HAD family hydrolase n=1 Tax=Candidatus Aphodoplasma excrementigallinarum TaxID=2840673 RepID=A0A9D1SYX1_9FIRM|nr:HAD family hydrolase [Candidatus Aphodoplasma excrementigallinarum]